MNLSNTFPWFIPLPVAHPAPGGDALLCGGAIAGLPSGATATLPPGGATFGAPGRPITAVDIGRTGGRELGGGALTIVDTGRAGGAPVGGAARCGGGTLGGPPRAIRGDALIDPRTPVPAAPALPLGGGARTEGGIALAG